MDLATPRAGYWFLLRQLRAVEELVSGAARMKLLKAQPGQEADGGERLL